MQASCRSRACTGRTHQRAGEVAIGLRDRYAMSVTDIVYGVATRRGSCPGELRYRPTLVLRDAQSRDSVWVHLPTHVQCCARYCHREWVDVSGLRARCAMPGTDLAYGVASEGQPWNLQRAKWEQLVPGRPTARRASYAKSGTDIRHVGKKATESLQFGMPRQRKPWSYLLQTGSRTG
eukprot:3159574-Rhodomonas_salina.3